MTGAPTQILVTLEPGTTLDQLAVTMGGLQAVRHVASTQIVTVKPEPEHVDQTRMARASRWMVLNHLGTVEERLGDSPLEGAMMLIMMELVGVVKGAKAFFELLNTHVGEVWTTDRHDQVRTCYSTLKRRIKDREKELGRESRFRLCGRRGLYGLEREYGPDKVITDAGYAKLRDTPHAQLAQLREEGMWI